MGMAGTGIVGFSARLSLPFGIAQLTAVVAAPVPALNLLTPRAWRSIPAFGYTGAYALASIAVAFGGTLILNA